MIKGKSTIQLFDAVTNKEIKKVVNNNMVTNAINNMLNIPNDYLLDSSFKNLCDTVMPIQTSGLGGILLWDSTLPEDANLTLPPLGVNNVGYAGDAYSGANKYRGSYNTNESGAIPNGYRHVWDFATDRANGTIKSLSLTSRRGGNTGLHYNNTDGIYAVTDNMRVTSNYGNGPMGYYLGCIAKDTYVFEDRQSTSSVFKLNYAHCFDTNNIGLAETTSLYNNIYDTKSLTFSDPISTNSTNTTHYYTKPVVYCYVRSGMLVWYASIDYKQGVILAEGKTTLTIPEKYGLTSIRGVTDDGIYVGVIDKTIKDGYPYTLTLFDFNGNFVHEALNDIHWNSDLASPIWQLGDKWYYGSGDCYQIDGTDYFKDNAKYNSRYSYNNKSIAPYVLTRGYNDNYQSVSLCLFYPYVGTINNLAEPVTKTSAQTMKITYELTNEGG